MESLESAAVKAMNEHSVRNYSDKVKKSSTSNTSSTDKGFSGIDPALTQHQPAPKLERNALIEETETKGETKRRLLIDSKAALIFQEALQGYIAHDASSQMWHQFTGSHWMPENSSIDNVLVEMLYAGAGDLGFKPAFKNGIKSLLTDGSMLPLPRNDAAKLPFLNGLLCLKTERLEPITPDNAQTWCLPHEYKPGADCPNIKAWLKLAVDNDSETVEYLRAWMAAVLHGRNDLQKFLHLKGSGGTGKGTFMRLLTALIGKTNTAITSLDQLEQNRFEAAMLYNKRLAVISDSDKYGGSINVLKAITGQDDIRLERKHQQQAGSFVFQGLVVMASNESLQVTDHTSGLDRRRITVIFDRRATNEEKQIWQWQGGEETVLHAELPGLVNWLLKLSQAEISQTIRNPPERIRSADLDAMTASNPIADWVTECCIPDNAAWTQIGDERKIQESGRETTFENSDRWLYANFRQWCQRAHKTALSSRRFKELLIQTCVTLGFSVNESRRNSGSGINGLRLRLEDEQKFHKRHESVIV
ncbi:hypothetical protein ABD07_03320 [Nitrosomonas oligotropha]|nr:hypothetical protein [Nitrosomonas oligotropha]